MSYRAVSVYLKASGLFTGRTLSGTGLTDELLAKSMAADEAHIEGRHDHQSSRVDLHSGQVVDYQPPQPSTDHAWNCGTKRWELTPAAAARANADRVARSQIRFLELNVLPRALRELALGQDGARDRVAKIDAQIAVLRPQLQAQGAK